jgi:hypothetical protein
MGDSDWEARQTAELNERASDARRLADQLARAGYRDQAARQFLEARLYKLRAAAVRATMRAA